MRIKLLTLIIAWAVILLSVLWLCIKASASFDDRVNRILSGGTVTTKALSMWELHQYKYTNLLRKSPMQYCPWEAYKAVRDHVHIADTTGFRYALTIDTDLKKLLRKNAIYNRDFARNFKVSGSKKWQVRRIFLWCNQTHYTTAYNTTRDCFERRQSACAGIAGAFYVLCRVNHIPVRYVIGWVEYGGGCHAWNKVQLDGKWYWIDCTYGWWLSRYAWEGRTVMEMW